ncbi:hypothetical protein [Pantoea sp. A4]|uniref:hypothetical protein n=1 Tax=Pantoea sp. A4 TaxID=1225184 RepID=UPI000B070F4C|nr:hypothetical protein [Pantoea sp. A4]
MSEEMNKQSVPDATNPNQPFVERRRFNNLFPVWQSRVWMVVVLGFGLITVLCILYACLVLDRQIPLLVSGINSNSMIAISGAAMIASQFLRGLSILMGGAIVFGGLSLSFFSGKDDSTFSTGDNQSVFKSVTLTTKTPGIFGIVIGGVIILYALHIPYDFQYKKGEMSASNQQHSRPVSENKNSQASINDKEKS